MKRQKNTKASQSNSVGILLEPLEPRLLLSGSWGAVVDASPTNSQVNAFGECSKEAVFLHANDGISDLKDLQQQRLQVM